MLGVRAPSRLPHHALHAMPDLNASLQSRALTCDRSPRPLARAVRRVMLQRRCFDFEAAATHEVGHVLGLSHPDNVAESLSVGGSTGTTPGQNVYSTILAGGGRLSELSCQSPWSWVEPGVPPGSEVDVRPSIMKALTQHNPSVCLTEDDLEVPCR